MTFEDDLRSTLHSQAGDLDLHGRGATAVISRARRRQHRARRAGVVAAAGVLTAGTVGVLSVRNGSNDEVSVASSGIGLPDVGPLELAWRSIPDGITGGVRGEPIMTQDASGTIYALATAPGTRYPEAGGALPAALYRLADDGTWQSVGSGPVPASDLTADGSVLYALSTSPGAAGFGYDSVLSSSTDGGATWSTASITPVAPPNAVVAWQASSTLSIESVPGASVAVVATAFSPPQSLLATAAAGAGGAADSSQLGYQYAADGIEVVSYAEPDPVGQAEREKAGKDAASGTTVAPPGADDVGGDPSRTGTTVPTGVPSTAGAAPTTSGNDVVTTIPWADLGLSGPADLGVRSQVLVHELDGWVPVDATALDGIAISSFRVVGQELVVDGSVDRADRDGGFDGHRTLASPDGRTWREVAVAEESRLLGLGNAWVDVPWNRGGQGPTVRSSLDRGATWQSTDLAAVDGRLAGSTITSVDSGPLGLAAVAVSYGADGSDADGSDPVSYLITTRDLTNWTVTPLSDLIGSSASAATVFVGNDRIVVSATEMFGSDPSIVPGSATVIGTPTR